VSAEDVPDLVTAERRAQGLPDRIEDPDALDKVARILAAHEARTAAARLPRRRASPPRPPQGVQVALPGGPVLSYAWAGAEPLAVGDRVELPRPYFMTDDGTPYVGEVVALGSAYDGELVTIRHRAT
jgi:hypothetical protein